MSVLGRLLRRLHRAGLSSSDSDYTLAKKQLAVRLQLWYLLLLGFLLPYSFSTVVPYSEARYVPFRAFLGLTGVASVATLALYALRGRFTPLYLSLCGYGLAVPYV
eukprot:RCo027546